MNDLVVTVALFAAIFIVARFVVALFLREIRDILGRPVAEPESETPRTPFDLLAERGVCADHAPQACDCLPKRQPQAQTEVYARHVTADELEAIRLAAAVPQLRERMAASDAEYGHAVWPTPTDPNAEVEPTDGRRFFAQRAAEMDAYLGIDRRQHDDLGLLDEPEPIDPDGPRPDNAWDRMPPDAGQIKRVNGSAL